MFKQVTVSSNIFRRFFSSNEKIGILGAPFGKGGSTEGQINGPQVIRNGGLINQLLTFKEKSKVIDHGDVEYKANPNENVGIENMKNYNHMVAFNKEISKKVETILRDNQTCVTIGGDHSIAVGTIDAHAKVKKDICVLYIDAHADINTNTTSQSGNIHGMPLALLASELSDYWPFLPGMDWRKPVISLRNVAFIGLRSVDPHERLLIDKLGITAFSTTDIEEHGIKTVLDMALRSIDPDRNRSIHVSFDIDAIDSLEAPSTELSVPGGLTVREAVYIMEKVHDTGRLGAIDLAEVNTALGDEHDLQKTVKAAIHIISAGVGYKTGGLKLNASSIPLQTDTPTRAQIF